jgi:hypothetical protein
MSKQRRRGLSALPGILGIVLAVIGAVVGNAVSDQIPTAWEPSALPALVVMIAAIGLVSALRRQVQGSGSWRDPRQRSRARRRVGLVLTGVYELLWLGGGLAENVTAGNLPTAIKPYAGVVLAVVTLIAIVLALFDYGLRTVPPIQEDTNRRNFLTKLHTRYSQRQEDALRGAMLITLGLHAEPEALSQPALTTGTLAATADGGDTGQPLLTDTRSLPAGTDLTEVYDAAAGQVLILGAPGAGKTTLLVALGLELVRRARADAKCPLPVIANLATWTQNRRPIEQWLVEDLEWTYQVPREVAARWVAESAVLPLLDGLDEVGPTDADRAACIAAINEFHHAHPQLPLVVCSRIEAYRAQAERLALHSAVVAQPLTDEQIDGYLTYGGEALAVLRAAVAADEALREVVRTPLLLRVVALTYEGLPREAIPPVGEHEAWMRQVFGEYVERMMHRRRRLEVAGTQSWEEVAQPEYPPEATTRYLAWLAGQMRGHGQVELYLERMQPDWLPSARARRNYHLGVGLIVGPGVGPVVGLVGGLIYGQVGGLYVGQVGGLLGLVGGLVGGPGNGLFVGLFVGLVFGLFVGLVFGLFVGLVFGLFVGLFVGLGDGLSYLLLFGGQAGLFNGLGDGLFVGLGDGLFVGLVFGLFIGLFGLFGGDIAPRAALQWSWRRLFVGLFVGPVFGLVFGLFVGLVFGLFGLEVGLVFELFFGLVGLVVGLFVGLFVGLRTKQVDEHDYHTPNEGIHRSGRNGVVYGLFVGLFVGLVYGLFYGLLGGLVYGLLGGLVYGVVGGLIGGLVVGLVVGLRAGGQAVIRHAALRWEFRRLGLVPPRLVHFLDYAADHILLQRVGGGYRFVHISLRDYFADLSPQPAGK